MAGLIVAMVGMLGLAIDGGRIYLDRRLLQNGSDSAALGAADAYAGWLLSHTGDTAGAQTAAVAAGAQEFGNMVQGSALAADTSPPASLGDCAATSSKYRTGDGSFRLWLQQIAPSHSHDPSARVYRACASNALNMAFIQVLNGVTVNNVLAEAEAISAQSIPVPGAVLFIQDPSNITGPFPCGSGMPKNSLDIGGGGSLEVNGSVVSDGNINISNNTAFSVYNNGQVLDHCDGSLVTNGNVCWITTPMPANPPSCGASSGTSQFQQASTFEDPLGARRLNWAASPNWFSGVDSGSVFQQTSPTDTNFLNTVELQPGKYADDPFPANTHGLCWFEEPGIYEWDHGLSGNNGATSGGLVSNELAPPGGVTAGAALPNGENPPFSWSGGGSPGSGAGANNCVGQVSVSGACTLLCTGTFYLRVASAREDKSLGGLATACSTGCWRESYLSNSTVASGCIQVPVTAGTSVQVAVSNVPGMGNTPGTGTSPGVAPATDANETLLGSRYDIYANSACSANDNTWVYVGSADFHNGTGTQSLSGLTNCPSLPGAPFSATDKFLVNNSCGLGYVVSPAISLATLLAGLTFNPVPPCSVSAPTTPGLLGSGACSPAYTANGTGNDVANEHYCVPSSGTGYCSILTPSPKDVTPGGVLYYMPSSVPTGSGSCLSDTNNGLQHYVYGNAELYDVVFYAPDSCSAHVTGSQGGEFTGWGYMPGSNDNLVLDGQGVPFNGGLDVWDLIIGGGGNLIIPGGIPTVTVLQPLGARLLVCTNTTPFCTGPV